MVKYKKVFMDYFGYDIGDYIPCVICTLPSIDIHHLKFRSQGGKDVIENLASVCRECHIKAHDNKEFNQKVKEKHLKLL
jgi:5-methylcytosine-specific restriction endonuclease McrA